jgi:hypothetical protein
MEDFIVKTIIGTYIIEDYGDKDYDVATNLSDSNIFYHIPKGLSEKEVQKYFEELKEIEK